MSYTDILFVFLLGAVAAISFLLRRRPAAKEWFLIGFSLLVIATWGYVDLALFLAVLGVNFVSARFLPRLAPGPSRWLLVGTISLDLAILVLFKYANFLGGSLASLTGITIPSFPLGIPLAISFYTFHLISYLVDIHAGKVRVATLRQYLFYLSFFPHVIAGPIVRAWQLVPQIGVRRRGRNDLAMGLHLLVVGFFLKSVGANNVAAVIDGYWKTDQWVEGGLLQLTVIDRWLVAFLYYCQIYGDFAGYTLMALGMARLLGYRLPPNFRSPMRAVGLQDFWRRWHITLSRWLRDYLYIPLGGGRCPAWRSAFNVMATMLLGGLWHGAGWGFVIWGAMHGAAIVAERLAGGAGRGGSAGRASGFASWGWLLGGWALTQLWITLAWVFFRSPSLPLAWNFASGMIGCGLPADPGAPLVHAHILSFLPLAFPAVAHHFAPWLIRRCGRRHLALVLGLITAILFIVNLVVLSPNAGFIYFKF